LNKEDGIGNFSFPIAAKMTDGRWAIDHVPGKDDEVASRMLSQVLYNRWRRKKDSLVLELLR
jgi:hypothetical protein